MFSGLLSKSDKDQPSKISVSSFEELRSKHPSGWAVSGDNPARRKKVLNLKPAEFSEFFFPLDPVDVQNKPAEAQKQDVAPEQPVISITGPASPGSASIATSEQIETRLREITDTFTRLRDSLNQTAERIIEHFEKQNVKTNAEQQQGFAEIARNVSGAVENGLRNQTELFAKLTQSVADALSTAGVKAEASRVVEPVLEEIRVKAESALGDVKESLGQFQARGDEAAQELRDLHSRIEQQLKTLRNLREDVNEDSADLLDRIKKYRVGEVDVLEQRTARLGADLDATRAERDTLNRELTTLRLESGQFDPAFVEGLQKELAETRPLKIRNRELEGQLEEREAELVDLRPLRDRELGQARDTRELNELRRWKQDYEQALADAQEEARLGQEGTRRLQTRLRENEREMNKLRLELAALDEDRKQIDDLRILATTEKTNSSGLRAEKLRLQNELAGLQTKHDALLAEHQQAKESFRRDQEMEVAQQLAGERERVHRDNLQLFHAEIEALKRERDRLQQGRDRVEELQHIADRLGEENFTLRSQVEMGLAAAYAKLKDDFSRLLQQQAALPDADRQLAEKRQQLAEQKDELARMREETAKARGAKAEVEGTLRAAQMQLDAQESRERQQNDELEKRRAAVFLPELRRTEDVLDVDSEWSWLKKIESGILDSGFAMSQRLLHAFHTSLKSQDISPLTLLMGISGTGKSELPRLYADLGGISFLNIAVQPNWDSPMDLFGFFNYTDNFFRSTALSRALHQFTSADAEQAMHDRLLLVLFDEMNLARVEYYFSDLLSRLESRRAVLRNPEEKRTDEELDRASVTLDLGRRTLRLFLAPNVLFAGTLNQDESTLSISDKVIDRANAITFPRPRTFVRGEPKEAIDHLKGQLHSNNWKEWCKGSSLTPETQKTLEREFQVINEALAHVHRGVGQRVFQAVLRYISLYPTQSVVPNERENALAKAKEDQYAMKIIPKLKGIHLHSEDGKRCIEKLRDVIPKSLQPDFDAAARREFFEWEGASALFEEAGK